MYTYRDGYISIEMMQNETAVRIPLDEWDRVCEAAMKGQAWIMVRTVHGFDVLVKIARIETVWRCTAEAQEEFRRLDREERRLQKAEGLTFDID